MRCRVFEFQRSVSRRRNNNAVFDDGGPNRNLAARGSSFSFSKGSVKGRRLIKFFQSHLRIIQKLVRIVQKRVHFIKVLQFQRLCVYQMNMTDKSTYDPAARKPLTLKKPRAPAAPAGARIAKVMARAGLCSRRDAEAWINAGRVRVNGVILTSPALNVTPKDAILVDNQPLTAPEPTRLFMFHKPRGTVTTDRDPEGRQTIFEVLPEWLPRVVTIGRLDINTEGLLLLTNDGGLARVLELPKTGWLRRYRVRAHGEITQPELDKLRDGITIEGVNYVGIEAVIDRVQGSNMWLTMGLREGKNREIKRVLEYLGLSVNRLIRVSFGPFQLQDLEEGAVEEIKTRIIEDQLGEALIQEAGCVFNEIVEREPRKRPEGGMGKMKPEQDFVGTAREPDEAPRRKHVKTMRDQRDKAMAVGPRVKTTRDATKDRRGRDVEVERVVRAAPQRSSRSTDDRGEKARYAPRSGHGDRPDFATRGERDTTRARAEPGARPPNAGQNIAGRNDSDARPSNSRPARGERKAYGDKPAFGDQKRRGAERPASGERSFKPRAKSEAGYEERPRTGRDFDKRQLSARSFKEREDTRGAKPAFKGERDAKPAYGARDAKPAYKPRADKPNRPTRGPAKPASGKPASGKPSSGKPGGTRPPRGR